MKLMKIKNIKKIDKKVKYEIEVKDNHNYFANGILKHNCRCIAICNNDAEWSFWSRQGKKIEVLDNLVPSLKNAFKGLKNVVLDGELCIVDNNGDENFTDVMKEIRRKDHTIAKPLYKIFDFLTTDEFYSKESKRTLLERHKDLSKYLIGKVGNIENLKQVEFNEESFADLQKQSAAGNWEGLMLRKDTTYKGKRSNDILKFKKFFDAEYEIIDVELGEMTFPVPGQGVEKFNALRSVKIKHKDCIVSVGSGFSKEQRIKYFNTPNELVGQTITVGYFEETKNQNGGYSLRFPTVKYIHGTEGRSF